MKILGLTGSLAMGKSTAANLLRSLGVPVHDADAVVHALLGPKGKAVDAVEAAFPGVRQGDQINRSALGQRVFGDDDALNRLEALLHPLVRCEEKKFLALAQRLNQKLVVLDIPLLFETGGQNRCDAVAVVTAPKFLQRQRALQRPGMSPEKFRAVLAHQMLDEEKRVRADFILQSGLGKAFTLKALRRIVTAMRRG
ncbi:MAG: dephospho-CoA kinase [Alphaproteobacteria bacterium RIFOXYD12_FULL_60_8]|nr:MAG: dephospho-CoA kinase [Alphaproteobacteria bacterium RIFOXYD12_FULL_60_8]